MDFLVNSYVDVLLLLILCYSILRGWQNGFLIGMVDLLSWLGSLFAAFRLYPFLADWLAPLLELPDMLVRPLSFAAIALVTGLLFSLMGRSLIDRVPARVHVTRLNRGAGLLTGLVNGLIVVAVLASLLVSLPLSGNLLVATRDSALAGRFAALTDGIENDLTPIFGDAISQTLNLLTVHPRSDEMVMLPYKVSDAVPAPELEAQMLELVNQERARAGLPQLEMDPQLTEVARRHSVDMFARGYFSHTTPEGLSPFDRMHAGGVNFNVAGENLAHASTLSIAHTGLMNSPGHRENILRPQFGRVGIGILDGGPKGLMVTQKFRD